MLVMLKVTNASAIVAASQLAISSKLITAFFAIPSILLSSWLIRKYKQNEREELREGTAFHGLHGSNSVDH